MTATFFNTRANEFARRQVIRQEARAGFALANHSWSHPFMPRLSASHQAIEMDRSPPAADPGT
ncbi:MAG TPA: polysaccharide deacetylase family protein [Streptosporangiaceae bacterium]|nr:polysaccharide deacetylase family protein [Streptosporangiaceae bacterium]